MLFAPEHGMIRMDEDELGICKIEATMNMLNESIRRICERLVKNTAVKEALSCR